ncbi:glycosyl hydrolase family 28 protein [Planctomycetota bacterium]
MKTTNKTTQCESFKTKTGHPSGLLTIGILLVAFTTLSVQVWGGTISATKVVTYPAPGDEALSEDYEVQASGQHVDTYMARVLDPPFAGKDWDYGGSYSFTNFDMSGPVVVRIVSKRSLRNVVIRPRSSGIQPRLEDDYTLNLTLDQPRKLSIEPDGKNGPLLLFANPMETDVPKPDDPGVVYFGPGVHKPEKIILESNQTLYLAGGAVVKAEVLAQGSNIRICGRGILDGSDWEWRKGPVGNLIAIRNSSDVQVNGITLRGSSHWTIVPKNSKRVTIRNVKLCNSRVQNDDGINPCNSQDVLITDCFIRSDDDCVALKGLDLSGSNNNVERITVENSILWCDRARIFLLGHESRAAFMRNITLRNLDIIHFSMTAFLLEPGEDMRLEDITIENIRFHGEGQKQFIRLRPVVNQYMRKKVPGFIRNVRFRDVAVEGQAGDYLVQIEGADAEHDVRDVSFENVSIMGARLTEGSSRVRIGKNTENIRFHTEGQ